jgi:hypothetical protein
MLGCEIEIENFNNNNNNKASVTIRLGKSSRASRMIKKIWQSNKTHEGTQEYQFAKKKRILPCEKNESDKGIGKYIRIYSQVKEAHGITQNNIV